MAALPESPPLAEPTHPEAKTHTVNVSTAHWQDYGPVVTLVCTCGWWLGYGPTYPLDQLAESGAAHLVEVSS
jgi:hypothetical protein